MAASEPRICDDEFMESLEMVLKSEPYGIPLRGLMVLYRGLTGKKLDFKERGYTNLQQLLESMPGVAKLVYDNKVGHIRVYNADPQLLHQSRADPQLLHQSPADPQLLHQSHADTQLLRQSAADTQLLHHSPPGPQLRSDSDQYLFDYLHREDQDRSKPSELEDETERRGGRVKEPPWELLINNLDDATTKEELLEIFEPYNCSFVHIRPTEDRQGVFGFAYFAHRQDLITALTTLDSTELNGNDLKLTLSTRSVEREERLHEASQNYQQRHEGGRSDNRQRRRNRKERGFNKEEDDFSTSVDDVWRPKDDQPVNKYATGRRRGTGGGMWDTRYDDHTPKQISYTQKQRAGEATEAEAATDDIGYTGNRQMSFSEFRKPGKRCDTVNIRGEGVGSDMPEDKGYRLENKQRNFLDQGEAELGGVSLGGVSLTVKGEVVGSEITTDSKDKLDNEQVELTDLGVTDQRGVTLTLSETERGRIDLQELIDTNESKSPASILIDPSLSIIAVSCSEEVISQTDIVTNTLLQDHQNPPKKYPTVRLNQSRIQIYSRCGEVEQVVSVGNYCDSVPIDSDKEKETSSIVKEITTKSLLSEQYGESSLNGIDVGKRQTVNISQRKYCRHSGDNISKTAQHKHILVYSRDWTDEQSLSEQSDVFVSTCFQGIFEASSDHQPGNVTAEDQYQSVSDSDSDYQPNKVGLDRNKKRDIVHDSDSDYHLSDMAGLEKKESALETDNRENESLSRSERNPQEEEGAAAQGNTFSPEIGDIASETKQISVLETCSDYRPKYVSAEAEKQSDSVQRCSSISLPNARWMFSRRKEFQDTMHPEVFEQMLVCVFPQFRAKCHDDMQSDDPLKVIISHVCEDNVHFWAQIITGEMKNDLLNILEMLANFERNTELGRVNTERRRAGAQFGGEWCRVWIEATDGPMALVHYVDFGNSDWLPTTELVELPAEYWTIGPAAAPFKVIGGEDMPVNLRDYINDEISLNVLAQEGPILLVTLDK